MSGYITQNDLLLKNLKEFYSKDDDELDKTIYLPGNFLNHQFVEHIKTQGYDLRFHIQVYSSENKSGYLYKNFAVTFYLTNKPIIDPGDIKTNLDNCDAQVQTHIDDSNYMDSEECDDENELIIKDWSNFKTFFKVIVPPSEQEMLGLKNQ